MMELRLLLVLVLVLALTLTGSDAQIDVCGRTIHNPNTRMVGGDDAPAIGWPWKAAVQNNNSICGGSLITDQWVLTAAQCVYGAKGNLIVALGTSTLNPVNIYGEIFSVSKIEVHPNYVPGSFEHDIALLELSSPVDITGFITPVCLAAEDSNFGAGTTFWTFGWGNIFTDVNLPLPGNLQEVALPLVSNEDCDKVYHGVTDNMMCAGGEPGRGPCNGDGGAPLVLESDYRWTQVGVLSFLSERGCAQGGFPAGFTRVSRYQQWISSTVRGLQPGFIKAGAPGLVPLSLLLGASLALSSVLVHS